MWDRSYQVVRLLEWATCCRGYPREDRQRLQVHQPGLRRWTQKQDIEHLLMSLAGPCRMAIEKLQRPIPRRVPPRALIHFAPVARSPMRNRYLRFRLCNPPG